MFNHVNEIIEVNLQLLFSSKNQSLIFSEFKDKNGKKLVQVIEFFQLLEKKKLIEIENNTCTLTEFGKNIVKNGGWLEYIKKEEAKK
jgi:predicted methyltransferase